VSSASFFGKVPWKIYGAWYFGCWWLAVPYNAGLSGIGHFVYGGPTESVLLDSVYKNNATILPGQAVAQWNEE